MSLEGVWERRLGSWRAACWRGASIIEAMVIDMNEAQVRTVEQVRQVEVQLRAQHTDACGQNSDTV